MIEVAAEHVKNIEVFTNGTLIDPSWVAFFKKHSVIVRVSLYSLDADNHDHVTSVQGSQAKTYGALQLLKEAGVKTTITSVMMKGLELHGVEHDPNFNNLDIVRMSGRASLHLMDRELVAKKLCVLQTFQRPLNVKQVKRSVDRNACFGYKLYIDTDLNVYPCSMERTLKHGNLREQTLEDLLNAEILHLSKDHIAECQDCEFRYACIECRPDRLDDNPYGKPWWCTYLPLEGRWQDPEQCIADLHLEP
jgi:radical SAM protein with 4Fe4S-binding SPASM domain